MRPWSLLASCTILLAGCAVAPIANHKPQVTPGPAPTNTKPLSGHVHGGQQAINGAQVYMLAVTYGAYGQQSTSLLGSTADTSSAGAVVGGWNYVTTNSAGSFTIAAGDYACPYQTGNPVPDEVYLYSVGGSPGIGNDANPNIGLMAVLGQCNPDGTFPLGLPAFIQMNEATTVAAAYALAGFALDATDMSASTSLLAATGIANAANTAGNLVDIGAGQALATTPYGNGTVPQYEINTLADILASCVNSTDTTYGSPSMACSTVLGTATDTASAAINIAHNPAANVPALFNLVTPTPPFQPTLSTQPDDWTVLVTYSGNGLSYPDGIATDSSGNVWVTDEFTIVQTGPDTFVSCDDPSTYGPGTVECGAISAFSPIGQPLNGSPFIGGGLYNPVGIAIDINGNAWIANNTPSNSAETISEFSSTGSPSGNSPISITGGNLCYPSQIAVDGYNYTWVIDGCQLTQFSNNGTQNFQLYGATLNGASGIALDQFDNVWISNFTYSQVGEYVYANSYAEANSGNGFTGGGLSNPQGVAVDLYGYIWLPDDLTYEVSEFSPAGAPYGGSPFTGAGQAQDAFAIAVDGTGNVWTINSNGCGMAMGANTGGPISEYTNYGVPISGSNGYQRNTDCSAPTGASPNSIAIDLSGNVWMAGNVGGGLGELVGAASPTAAPFSLAISYDQLGQEP